MDGRDFQMWVSSPKPASEHQTQALGSSTWLLVRESISASPKYNVWIPPHPTQKLKKGEIL